MPPHRRVKCLLVDDLEENLLALSALLRDDDVEILLARSGFEALELLLVHDVALAMLDVQMPDMDGFELAELIRGRERTRHVPLIFVTAGARDQHRLFKGYDTGAVDFLYKPIEPRILKNKAAVFFQLDRQKQQLAEDLKERTETLRLNELFMAVLGHDLRTPLSAIIMSATVLNRGANNESVQKCGARIVSSGKRMSRMIEDMLDFARARLAGGIAIKREPVDLGAVMQRVVQECSASHPQRSIQVQASGDLHGQWDPDRLAQVASNLLGNALQHGEGDGPIEIRLDGSEPGQVSWSIANEGTIAPDTLAHLFDPFRGGDRNLGRGDGLGLGLYIVQQIVQSHQGQVDVSSREGAPTVFRVTLPRGEA
ncbi:MAG: HAMP domain-containing histidine kinase [Rubrivivax sp.]|nr:MAG: HAMP domain-containing histidine kinase [Rubrivivax sp.]